jgi:flavin-dependent dehydrogenase
MNERSVKKLSSNDTRLNSRQMSGYESSVKLENAARVAIMGGGPAGSFFSYFLLGLAEKVGIDLMVDIYEPRDFSLPAPQGCNMCAGVISETLVQNLATEGINLPASVVQRAINSYTLHMDVGSQQIDAAHKEKRIGAVYRGGGPRDIKETQLQGFDAHLLSLAESKGANVIRSRVIGVERDDDSLRIKTSKNATVAYDLLAVATGVNSAALKLFEDKGLKYKPPQTTKTALCEYYLGRETVDRYFKDSLQVFLLDIPKLDFAMIVPKGDYVSVCMLGKDIDDNMRQAFFTAPEVSRCFPDGWRWDQPACQCMPRINIRAAKQPYMDRVVFIGDSGVTRLYKDGIGAAYRAAKAAAACAILEGISAEDFQRHYAPFCQRVELDNQFGRLIFSVTHIIQRARFSRKAVMQMLAAEQYSPGNPPRMSGVLWDTFTGSAPYQDVFKRTLHPAFLGRFAWDLVSSVMQD